MRQVGGNNLYAFYVVTNMHAFSSNGDAIRFNDIEVLNNISIPSFQFLYVDKD
jgi:hypothetical protein